MLVQDETEEFLPLAVYTNDSRKYVHYFGYLCLYRVMVKGMRAIHWTFAWILSAVKKTLNERGERAQLAHAHPATNSPLTGPPNTRNQSMFNSLIPNNA